MRDYLALLTRWQEDQARQDRRTQQVVWILAEINRNSEKRSSPYELSDFDLHHWGLVERGEKTTRSQEPILTAEQIAWSQINAMRAGAAQVFGSAAAVIHHNGSGKE